MKPLLFLIAMVAAGLLFYLMPEIDLAASALFYRDGHRFFLGNWWPNLVIYELVELTSWSVAIAFGLWTLARALRPLRRFHIRSSAMVYIALSLILGPGIVTNTIIKDHMGRARPSQIVEFGGTKQFTPAPLPADQCRKNCSFVSGHAATGFFLATFVFMMAPGLRRKAAFAGVIATGTVIGVSRMAEGAHFLSDVVFAGFINIGVAWVLYTWIGARGSPGDRALTRMDDRLRATERPGALVVSHPHAFVAVFALCMLCIVFIDRPALRWFLTFDWDLHLIFKWIADWGRQVFWAVPSGVAFIALWLAARAPGFAAAQERLKAWSMLPLFIFLSLSVTGIASQILKISFGRMRPLHYYRHDDYGFAWFELDGSLQSFPSGHAVTIATLTAALILIWPRATVLWATFGLTVISARVLETAHFISDAILATYLGIALTVWMHNVFKRSGIDLDQAKDGVFKPGPRLPWGERLGMPGWRGRGAAAPAAEGEKP